MSEPTASPHSPPQGTPQTPPRSAPKPLPQPPPLAGRWVRFLLGFGVSVAVALAPLLGQRRIPFFEPLLDILPPDERTVAIPLSAMLMGIVAVAVQWYGYEKLARFRLRRAFGRTLLATVVLLVGFFIVNVYTVTRVPVDTDTAILLHGFGDPGCSQCTDRSVVECLREISFDPGGIDRCWGTTNVRNARVALTLSYLATMSLFGALVGLLVLGTAVRTEDER